jgi:hypothetical protein
MDGNPFKQSVETLQSSRVAQIGQPGKDILSLPLGSSNSTSEASTPRQAGLDGGPSGRLEG